MTGYASTQYPTPTVLLLLGTRNRMLGCPAIDKAEKTFGRPVDPLACVNRAGHVRWRKTTSASPPVLKELVFLPANDDRVMPD